MSQRLIALNLIMGQHMELIRFQWEVLPERKLQGNNKIMHKRDEKNHISLLIFPLSSIQSFIFFSPLHFPIQ